MKPYQNILLITDLDGTLINSNHQVDTGNIAALEQFTAGGGSFAIATGRTFDSAYPYIKDLPINFPCVFYNGSLTFDIHTRKVIAMEQLKHQPLLPFLEQLRVNSPQTMIQVFTPEQLYFLHEPGPMDPSVIRESHDYIHVTLEEVMDKHWLKLLLYDDPKPLALLGKDIIGGSLSTEMDILFSAPFYLEFLPKDKSKGSAIEGLRQSDLGRNKFIVSVGDFENDIRMLKMSDLGIAVENACPSLKAAADLITVSNDQSALREIIQNILPAYLPVSQQKTTSALHS